MKPFLLLTVLFLHFSCSSDNSVDLLNANLVLIVYLAADNDLSMDAVANLAQIEKAYRTTSAKLVVFIDALNERPRLLEITDSGQLLIEEYDDPNSVSPNIMNDVLLEIVKLYPAKHYGLILWSHGTSWLPANSYLRVDVNDKKNAFGDDKGKQMNIQELASALPLKFEFILFDACLMGAIEVAYELRNNTNYILSPSTETIADGFPYDLIIPELLKPDYRLSKIAQAYFNFYNNQRGAYRSATISLIKTSELDSLALQFRALFVNNPPDLYSFKRASVQRLDVYDEQYHFDLMDFIQKVQPASDKQSFVKQLEKCVIYKAHTPRFVEMFDIVNYCGLSCYIAHPDRIDLNEYYKSLEWYTSAGLDSWFLH